MAGGEHQYGAPKVHSYSATLIGASGSQDLAAAPQSGPKVKITLHGEDFFEGAMPLIVRIGDQVIMSGFEMAPDSLSFYLDELPEDGAAIQVGYGGQLAELPERFSHSELQSDDSEQA